MNDALAKLEEFSSRVARDLDTLDKMMQRKVESSSTLRQRMDLSAEVVYNASALLISLSNIRMQINYTYRESGRFELTATRKNLLEDVSELVKNVKSVLYALSEELKTLKELDKPIEEVLEGDSNV